MPPHVSSAVASSMFNLTRLWETLPITSRSQAFVKCSACLFSTSPAQLSIGKKKVRRRIDPYREAQARQRKAANVARQAVLKKERKEAMGDPIRSSPTPFVQSLTQRPGSGASSDYLNFFVTPDLFNKALDHSRWLTEPLPRENANLLDPVEEERRKKKHTAQHENARKSLLAISALENGSSKDRTRVNVQRCVTTFGRHNTDSFLPPKLASIPLFSSSTATTPPAGAKPEESSHAAEEVPKRAGPDTGSSEVQIAILTAKINVLAGNLNKKDKHNKRNLRLLVHRRQKLLSYLRRKERGGPRWQHVVEQLGIGDAMWRGEISL